MHPNTTTLRTAPLGSTGMRITRIGFGAWAIGGGGWEFGWGPQEDAESVGAIERALELGVNWIDTAAAYGFGHSEEVVGRALARIGADARPYVFTKCSLLEGPDRRVVHSLKRDSVLREAEASVKRLGGEPIDLYQIHWPNPLAEIEEGWAALAELKDQGLVRHIGVSNFQPEQLNRIRSIAPVETLQPPYSLVERSVEAEILPYAESRGHRRDRLLADGLGIAHRRDDPRADRRARRGRLAQARRPLQRAAAHAAPCARRPARVRRRAARHQPWGRRRRVDAAQPRRRRGDRGLPPRRQVDPLIAAANLELDYADVQEIEHGTEA